MGREHTAEGPVAEVVLEVRPVARHVGVVGRSEGRLGAERGRAHRPGDPRAQPVGPDDKTPTELEGAGAVAGHHPGDPTRARPGDALDRDAHPDVGARGAGRVDEQRVQHGAPGRHQGVDAVAPPSRRVTTPSVSWKETSRRAGAPDASTPSSRPHRWSCTTPLRAIAWVDSVSAGNVARSTSTTSWPARASSRAVAAPAQRAPTTTTSCRSAGRVGERIARSPVPREAPEASPTTMRPCPACALGGRVERTWRHLAPGALAGRVRGRRPEALSPGAW